MFPFQSKRRLTFRIRRYTFFLIWLLCLCFIVLCGRHKQKIVCVLLGTLVAYVQVLFFRYKFTHLCSFLLIVLLCRCLIHFCISSRCSDFDQSWSIGSSCVWRIWLLEQTRLWIIIVGVYFYESWVSLPDCHNRSILHHFQTTEGTILILYIIISTLVLLNWILLSHFLEIGLVYHFRRWICINGQVLGNVLFKVC